MTPVGAPAHPARPDGDRRARWVWLAVVVVLGVVVALAWRADRANAQRLSQARQRLAVTRAAYRHTSKALNAQRNREVTLLHQVDALAQQGAAARAAADQLGTALDDAKRGLAVTETSRTTQNARLAAVSSCLSGVSGAVEATKLGDTATAVARLRGVSGACEAASAIGGSDAPVYALDFADPSVIVAGPRFYAFSTNAGAGTVQVISSTDLRSWDVLGNALGNLPRWAARNSTWAPAVIATPRGYLMFYTVREASTGRQCISVAAAVHPEGPYLDGTTRPLVCEGGGSIDPSPVISADGTLYLQWKDEGPARIVSRRLSPDGGTLLGDTSVLLSARQPWEHGNVEAPAMIRSASGYWLFYSGNEWSGSAYAEGVVPCDGPMGPCGRNPATPFLSSHGSIAGPGGASVVRDAAGVLWIAYHAYRAPDVGYPNSRFLHISRLGFAADGRPVMGG